MIMKKALAFVTAAVMLITAAGCTNKEESVVLAQSGDEKVLLSQYLYYYNSNKMYTESAMISYGLYTQETIADYWNQAQGDGDKTIEQSLQEESLKNVKEDFTLAKLARDAGFKEDPESVKSISSSIDEEVKTLSADGKNGKAEFEKKFGISVEGLKKLYGTYSSISQYTESLQAGVNVSDEQAKAYYDEHLDEFKKVTVRHVLIKSDDSKTPDEQKAAETKANEILKKVNEGQDIGKLAAEFTEDTASKDTNGEYTFARGEMVSEFEEWAFKAKPGETGVVKTTYGYHVMQLIDDNAADFETSKPEIVELLTNEETTKLVEEAIQNANLEWTVNEEVLKQAHPQA